MPGVPLWPASGKVGHATLRIPAEIAENGRLAFLSRVWHLHIHAEGLTLAHHLCIVAHSGEVSSAALALAAAFASVAPHSDQGPLIAIRVALQHKSGPQRCVRLAVAGDEEVIARAFRIAAGHEQNLILLGHQHVVTPVLRTLHHQSLLCGAVAGRLQVGRGDARPQTLLQVVGKFEAAPLPRLRRNVSYRRLWMHTATLQFPDRALGPFDRTLDLLCHSCC
mmetsp:Transcript_21955/g.46675  ORF Transcript_21955/g.46675 Transcript_21955/m.46675 type:complete len:222 (+) Transcript_21955:284-949(+)